MLQQHRQEQILDLLRSQGSATGTELAQKLQVSAATIRRDLEMLDANGELVRVYGGAVLQDGEAHQNRHEAPFEVVNRFESTSRDVVAKRAAELVTDGSIILLDIGTTTARLAGYLRGRPITVVTNSLAVLDVLRDDSAVQLVLLGGVVRRNYKSMVGALAEEALKQVSVDQVFLSAAAVRRDGSVADDMLVETTQKKMMLNAGQSIILLTPPTKFSASAAFRICSLDDIDVVLTTKGASPEAIEMCQAHCQEVIVA